jgi:hypothetical protein
MEIEKKYKVKFAYKVKGERPFPWFCVPPKGDSSFRLLKLVKPICRVIVCAVGLGRV